MVKTAYDLNHHARSVAVFGGAFDPPHWGHVLIVLMARLFLPVDHFYLVPSANRLDKSSIQASGMHRIKMLERLFKSANQVSISDYELRFSNQKSQTFYTAKYFKQHHPVIYLLLGADAWAGFKDWYQSEKLKKMVKIVVFSRYGFKNLSICLKDVDQWIEIPQIQASSSDIRQSIMNHQILQSNSHQLPSCVLEYIDEYKLYQNF